VAELKAAGSTILMTTHEMQFARKVADQVIFLHDGVIVEQAPPAELFDNPRHPATKEYLARVHTAG
jgi:ABC-type polar amino acid transport system ATPase subunit